MLVTYVETLTIRETAAQEIEVRETGKKIQLKGDKSG
jgi:hypothetical protein